MVVMNKIKMHKYYMNHKYITNNTIISVSY